MWGCRSIPTYYVPEYLVAKLEKAREVFLDIDATCCIHGAEQNQHKREEGQMNMNIVGIKAGEEIELKQQKIRNGVRFYLRPFSVSHGGHPALGYCIVSKTTTSSLKSEYKGMDGKQLGDLARSGIKIKEFKQIERAEVLYSGDTCIDGLINVKDPDDAENSMSVEYLRQGFTAPLILCELTFLDPKDADLARRRGHLNIKDIEKILQSHEFRGFDDKSDDDLKNYDRQKIVFYHISSRHAPLERILDCMSKELSDRVLDIADVAISSFLLPSSNLKEVPHNGCISIRDHVNNKGKQT